MSGGYDGQIDGQPARPRKSTVGILLHAPGLVHLASRRRNLEAAAHAMACIFNELRWEQHRAATELAFGSSVGAVAAASGRCH